MGKTLETLRRRDPAHSIPGEPIRRDEDESSPQSKVASATRDTPSDTIPFIEVGAGAQSDNLSTGQPAGQMDSAPARATVNGPPYSMGGVSGTAPGLIQFRPQPRFASSLAPDPAGSGIEERADSLVVRSRPESAEAQSYRLAAEVLAAEIAAQGTRAISLCPVGISEHLIAGAANLALVLAEGGRRRILLIDASEPMYGADVLTSATLASVLGQTAGPGWRELMAGMSPALVTQAAGWYRLHFIAGGAPLAASRRNVDGARIASIVDDFRRAYDLTIFLTTPWGAQRQLPLPHHSLDAACLITCPHAGGPPPDAEINEWISRNETCVVGTLALRH